MKEEWRPVKGWEGYYEVSDLGRVKSCKRIVIGKNGNRYNYEEKIMKLANNHSGYKIAILTKNSQSVKIPAHRLVGFMFMPNPENKPHINHIDANKVNNRVENLEWVTPQENSTHAIGAGLIGRGSSHTQAKLNEIDVLCIRDFHRRKRLSNDEIAELFKIHPRTVRSIVSYEAWKHIP